MEGREWKGEGRRETGDGRARLNELRAAVTTNQPGLRTILRWQDVDPEGLRGHTVVVLDVLRWSTVVITALANGARAVEAHATPAEAIMRASVLGRGQVQLGGERGSIAIPGFDLGNSPLEYTRERLEGRIVITTTTNGSQALLAARQARATLIGAFTNLDALVARLAGELGHGPITLLCAGQAGEAAAEDTSCAGAIAARLGVSGADDSPTARALELWQRSGSDAATAVASAPHAASLKRAGFDADVRFAATVSLFDLIPAVAPACDGGERGRILRSSP